MKRTQIYVEEDQDQRLAERAAALGVARSDLIRRAVEHYLDADDTSRRLAAFRAAVAATAGAARAGEGAIEQLREADADRFDELQRR